LALCAPPTPSAVLAVDLGVRHGPKRLSMKEEQQALSKLAKELRDIEDRAETDRAILREYAAINRDPIYAAPGMLVSAALAKLLRGS
jgi:hypothetical protein